MKEIANVESTALLELYCPFDLIVHPHREEIIEYDIQWARRFHLIQGEAALRRFSASRIGQLPASAYPEATLEDVLLISQFMVWLFMFDDQFDEGELGRTPQRVQPVFDSLIAVLNNALATSQSPVVASLAAFWQEVRKQTTPIWQQRFVEHVVDYFQAYIWETNNRARQAIPDLDAYILHRRIAGGMPATFDLIEISRQIQLPEQVHNCQEFQILQRAAGNVICWHNDLYSVQKELARGDVHNLVIVLRQAHHCSLQDAYHLAVRLVNAEVRLFIETERKLPSFSPNIDSSVQAYIDDMRHWMRGHLDWTSSSGRFTLVEQTAPTQRVSYLESIL